MSLSEELVRGASFTPILGAQGASLDSTPIFPAMDQDHGSYDPSSPLMFGETEPLVNSCTRISTPVVTSTAFQINCQQQRARQQSLPEQFIPVTQSEERKVEVSLGASREEGLTDRAEVNSEADENLMPQLLPTENISIVSGDGTERGRKQWTEGNGGRPGIQKEATGGQGR